METKEWEIETLLKGERLKKDNDRKNAKIAQKLPNGLLATSHYSSKRCPN